MNPLPPVSHHAVALRSSMIRDLLHLTERPDIISLAGGLPAEEALPTDALRRCADDVLGRLGPAALQYGPTEGLADLRALLAERLTARTGRVHAPEQVLVVGGSQQAFDLLAKVFVDSGAVVALEDPGYLGAAQALMFSQPSVLPVPVDAEGLDTDAFDRSLERSGLRPALVSTNPNFQNPTGAVASNERRAHLARLAEEHGFLVVEDDPYGELWHRTEPPPPVAALSDRVVSVGTFSKTVAPGLRVGWVAGPGELVEWLARAKQSADLHTATLSQHLVLELLRDGAWWARHLDGLRSLYRDRAQALAAALRQHLGETLDVRDPGGGMFIWARITTPGLRAVDVFQAAVQAGVAFVPGEAFHCGPPDHATLRLSFATVPPPVLEEGAERLAKAVAAVANQAPARPVTPAAAR